MPGSNGEALVSLQCLQEVNPGNTTRVKRKLALTGRVGIKIPPVCKHSSRTGIWEGASRQQVPSALVFSPWHGPNSDYTSPVSKHRLGKVSCFPQDSGNILEAKGRERELICFISWQVSFWEAMGSVVYQPPWPPPSLFSPKPCFSTHPEKALWLTP